MPGDCRVCGEFDPLLEVDGRCQECRERADSEAEAELASARDAHRIRVFDRPDFWFGDHGWKPEHLRARAGARP